MIPHHAARTRRTRFVSSIQSPTTPSSCGLFESSLRRLRQSATRTSDVRIELPDEGAVRMRNLVHRGTQRPVFKVSSLTIGRVVQCESLLEVDAVLCLDAHPGSAYFSEQPLRIHYLHDGAWRSHVPDLAVLTHGKLVLVEVKFDKDVTDDIVARTTHLTLSLSRLGVDYRLINEDSIRQGHAVQNAHRLLRRARHAAEEVDLLYVLEHVRCRDDLTLEDFDWDVPSSREASCIAQLILRGLAQVQTAELLTGALRVWSSKQTREEASLW